MIIAILMAGGKGERLEVDVEKPLFELNDIPLINYVLDNIFESKYIEKVVVATSPNTSNTKSYLKNNYNIVDYFSSSNLDETLFYLETSGHGYLEDLSFILETFQLNSKKDILLFINADLPLVSADIIDYVIENYKKSSKPAYSVLVPVEIFEENGLNYSYDFNGLVPSGLNILRSENIIQEEDILIIPRVELAFNINSLNEASKFVDFK